MHSTLLTSLLFYFSFSFPPPFSLFSSFSFFFFLLLLLLINIIINNNNNERNAYPELVPKTITLQFALPFRQFVGRRLCVCCFLISATITCFFFFFSAPVYTTNVRNRHLQLDGTRFSCSPGAKIRVFPTAVQISSVATYCCLQPRLPFCASSHLVLESCGKKGLLPGARSGSPAVGNCGALGSEGASKLGIYRPLFRAPFLTSHLNVRLSTEAENKLKT